MDRNGETGAGGMGRRMGRGMGRENRRKIGRGKEQGMREQRDEEG